MTNTPPTWLTNRLANPVLRRMLKSPLGPGLGRHLAVLRYRGRQTGALHELVAQYARDGSVVWIRPGNPEGKIWWRNLRASAAVEMWLAGEHVHGLARAMEGSHDPGPVAKGLGVYLGHFPRERKSPGIGPDSDPSDPADDELVALTVMVRVDLLE